MRTDQKLAAYIGLDWGDQRPAVQIQAAAGGPVDQSELEQRPHVLHGWVAQLRERFGGRPVGIAIEQRRGAVIHARMQYEFLVLYPVNPKALARYREAFHPSGAKDDPTDAALLLDLLRKHRDQLRPWHPDTVTARQLQLLCEHRRKLVNLRGGLTNRITSLLKQYFPQALDWVGTLDSRQACDFLTKWPTLAAVQRARPTTVRRFYQQHNCRRAPVIATRLDQMATAQPLTTDPAIVDTLALAVQSYAAQLRPLLEAIDTFDTQIAAVFAAPPGSGAVQEFPRRRGRLHAPPCGRLRHRPHPLGRGDRAPVTRGQRAGHRTQRQGPLGASPPGLSEVPQADVSRICRPVDPLLRLGAPLLRSAARPRQHPSCHPPIARLQMDADSLSLLAGPDPLRRSQVSRRAPPTRVATRQRIGLTAQLRCPCPLRRGGLRSDRGREWCRLSTTCVQAAIESQRDLQETRPPL